MSLYYNKSESENFAKLGINANGNAVIEFSEATIIENDDYVELYAYVNKGDEIIKTAKGSDGKFSRDEFFVFVPQICRFTLTKKEHEREYNGKKTKKVPTEKELLIIEVIQKLNSKYFKGKIDFNASDSIVASYYNDVSSNNLDRAKLYLNLLCEIEPLEESEVQHLSDISFESTKKKTGYTSKGQSEAERLQDRYLFVKAYMLGNAEDPSLSDEVPFNDALSIFKSVCIEDTDAGIMRSELLKMILAMKH